jgi:hypothetical protein
MVDDTHVHQAPNGGDGGRGGLYALLAIIIALIIVAIVLFLPGDRGGDGTRDVDIRIETPSLPDGNGGPGGSPPTDGGN